MYIQVYNHVHYITFCPHNQFELYFGLVVFCGFILFDTQLIVEKFNCGDSDYVWHSIDLFLDFVNIFRRLLIILANKVSFKIITCIYILVVLLLYSTVKSSAILPEIFKWINFRCFHGLTCFHENQTHQILTFPKNSLLMCMRITAKTLRFIYVRNTKVTWSLIPIYTCALYV